MQNHICQVAAICTCVFESSAQCIAHAKSLLLEHFLFFPHISTVGRVVYQNSFFNPSQPKEISRQNSQTNIRLVTYNIEGFNANAPFSHENNPQQS